MHRTEHYTDNYNIHMIDLYMCFNDIEVKNFPNIINKQSITILIKCTCTYNRNLFTITVYSGTGTEPKNPVGNPKPCTNL